MRQYQAIGVEREGPVEIIYLNRPEQLNTLSFTMIDEMEQAIADLSADREVRVLVFTGRGKAFCAGVNLKDVAAMEKPLDSYRFLTRLQSLINRVAGLAIPTIGAVNGPALGGGFELSLAFDFLVAADNAEFGVPEINVGALPGAGGMSRLPKMLGMSLAKRLVLLGEKLPAARAYDWGLVYKVTGPAELMDEARVLAQVLAKKPPVNLAMAKDVLARSANMNVGDAMQYEAHAVALLYDTEDRKEGMRAFLEKRRPAFEGR